jgi:hypothetical protein
LVPSLLYFASLDRYVVMDGKLGQRIRVMITDPPNARPSIWSRPYENQHRGHLPMGGADIALFAADPNTDLPTSERSDETGPLVFHSYRSDLRVVGNGPCRSRLVVNESGSFSGFPQCGSALAHDTARAAFANAPIGKLSGLEIIDFRYDREISSTYTMKQCTANVTLNSGVEAVADYSREICGSQYFVFIQVR